MKVQVYMKASKVKNVDKHTKKAPTIKIWDETNKTITKKSTYTTWYHRQLRR